MLPEYYQVRYRILVEALTHLGFRYVYSQMQPEPYPIATLCRRFTTSTAEFDIQTKLIATKKT